MASTTKFQFKEKVVNQLMETILYNAPFNFTPIGGSQIEFNQDYLLEINKYVTSGGTIGQYDGTSERVILYQQDYQTGQSSAFDSSIQTLMACLQIDGDTYEDVPLADYYFYNDSGEHLAGYTNDGGYEYPHIAIQGLACTAGGNNTFTFEVKNIISYLGQIIGISNARSMVDVDQAKEILDTSIYELLPTQLSRQEQINKLFTSYANLKPPQIPLYDENNPTLLTAQEKLNYEQQYGVDYKPKTGYIPRLTDYAGDINLSQNLLWLRNDINRYLRDIDEVVDVDLSEDLPEYESKSEGYLQIRNLNQGIIIRKENDDIIDFIKSKTIMAADTHFITQGYAAGNSLPSYLYDGFTITMWVKFLDRVSEGTLFNFGNPVRTNNPMGFRLSTFSEDSSTFGYTIPNEMPDGNIPFSDNDYTRFIKLSVLEEDGTLRQSNTGFTAQNGVAFNRTAAGANPNSFEFTSVPINFEEWYFICASYDPKIDEAGSGGIGDANIDFWKNNVEGDGTTYTEYSELGAKCKVDIISKSDLLRARGYKTT
tara:strand:+ start:921 stop:2537 length:1617 start_codon:yes stop_codon:yes gene_type:complete